MRRSTSESSGASSSGVVPWLCAALIAAAVNTGLGVILSDEGVKTPAELSQVFIATLIVVLGLQVVLWALYRVSALVVTRLDPAAASLVSSAGVLAVALLLPLAELLPGQPGAGAILVTALTVLGGVATAWFAYRLLSHFADALDPWPAWLSVFLPIVSVVAVACVWLSKIEVELVSDATGLPTWQAMGTALGFLLLTGIAMPLSRFLTRRLGAARMLALLSLILVAVAALIVIGSRRQPAQMAGQGERSGAVDHVVLVTVDTLRADSIGHRVRGRSLTPRLDALFEESLVFTQARSPSPWTKPAMASMLTGLAPEVHGATARTSGLPNAVTTLAERFAEAGYRTAAIGRNGSLSAGFRFDQGFDEFDIFPGADTRGNPALGAALLRRLGLVTTNPSTLELARMAGRWIDANAETPFFLWVHFFDPHAPYAPPDAYMPPGNPEPGIGRYYRSNAEVRGGFLVLDDRQKAWVKELYDAEVRLVDEGVGRVIDSLERNGILDDALVVFSSDHGEELFEHGLSGHGHTLFDEVLRVPLAIKLPGGSRSGEHHQSVSTESIAATMIELAGVSPSALPDSVAKSLSWAWSGDEPAGAERPVISSAFLYFQDQIGVVYDDWKYIHKYGAGPDLLFALEADPEEWHTLIDAQPEVAAEARRIIEAYVQWVQIARQELGLEGDAETELTPELREDLKALGYIQ